MMFDLMPFDRGSKSLSQYFDRFDKEFFGDFAPGFQIDILDQGDSFVLEAELPGFKKEEIHVDIDGPRLTIRAEHTEESAQGNEKNYVRRERRSRSCVRSFDISNIRTDAISAAYNSGILEVRLPKLAESQPAARQVEIQ